MATREITCGDCQQVFVVERGARSKAGRWPNYCPACREKRDRESNREKQYRWRAANPEKWQAVQDRANAKRLSNPEYRRDKRERELWRNYGIGPEERQRLVEAQGGNCAICGYSPPPQDDSMPLPRGRASTGLHVDHCHVGGQVRGLLCGACNTALGLFRDDPAILAAAIEYLRR